ncbi:MAG TPA: UDP-N-acetylmuramate:L-alanyl-gamma-D-glutamyl-meso-diaminopimelate ligase [Terriglobales bacterium]|jgi:UDP-N-acetylmuramate: L-alanyl-gamma-D-glutamyl-meso-diaminopimelate ligase|nr:UDP-N-acetylmuramate:L-alanyl-gamma-D-glutamyl-meso-diaminopimelate ligase [Terriglobales bacterium]
MPDQQHVHLIGVCGTAMASLAGMLKQRGFRVTGSDAAAYPPMSDFLASLGVPVAQPYAEANLKPRPDLVVVGNAISRGNAELEHVLDERIPMRSLPQILQEYFLRGREPIVVAGTHGKTTTTSMLAWIFETAGLKPSFLVGGIAENFNSSFAVRQGKHFIIEGDEYDTAFFDKGPKFLHYTPDAAVLTSVEFDHADIYPDLDAVKTAFKRLVNLVPRRGLLVAWDGSLRPSAPTSGAPGTPLETNIDECIARAFCRVERYGLSERADWQVRELRFESERTTWAVFRGGQRWADLEFSLAGEYNVLNATAAAAMAAGYGIATETIYSALVTFKSVKRRLELKAEVNGITIIDDFAHHPTAIAGTLRTLRTVYPGRRLWAVFEPRSNTLRRKVFESELVASLGLADEVVIAGVYRADAIPEAQRLSVAAIVDGLVRRGKPARELADADAIVATIAPELRSGDVVAILSNGGFGGIYDKLPQRLNSGNEVSSRA